MKLKKILAAITAVSLAVSTVSAVCFTASAEENDGITVSEEYSVETTSDLPDGAELEAMYIDQLFYGDSGISLFADYGSSHLSGNQLTLYNFLKPKIEGVANGTITNTSFNYTPTASIGSTALYNDISAAVHCLMVDLPQSFYWYDKTDGTQMSFSGSGKQPDGSLTRVTACTISFSVSSNYGSGTTVNPARINSAKTAVANARAIAASYNGQSDYEKIMGYKNEICTLTSYNSSAVNSSTPYGDPWQLVYVFDRDPSTNVVCEGYAKAFQYLCDLGGIDCYTVTGVMGGGTGAGDHMWNIVSLGGKNYLVDVTNCDTGTIGSPDKLCLKGASVSTAGGCTVNGVRFTYDSDTLAMYPASILTVSTTDYDPDNTDTPSVDTVYITVSPRESTLNIGETVDLNADVTGGDGAITWESTNTAVATVDETGLVTAVGAGVCEIRALYNGEFFTNQSTNYAVITVSDNGGSNPPDDDIWYRIVVEDVSLVVGESVTRIASVTYYDAIIGANKGITSGGVASDYFKWSIENTSVATIDQSGLVTAVAPGTTRGTVKFYDDYFPNGYVEQSFNVTVRAASSTPDTPDTPDTPSEPSRPSRPSEPSGPSNPSKPSDPSLPSTPSRPIDPSDPSEPSIPSDPSVPSKPSASTSTSSSNSSNPSPVTSAAVADVILAIPDGGNGSVTLGSSAKLDKATIETLAAKDGVTIRFNISGGAYWEINGNNITDAKAVDLGVRVNGTLIPENTVAEFAGDRTTIQLSLKHNGDFGFTGTLNVPVGKANSGKFANLYYYHGGQFDFVSSSAITDGRAKFAFSHASNYLIVIDDYAYGEDVSSAIGMNETTEANTVPFAAALAVLSAFGASAAILKKRLSK